MPIETRQGVEEWSAQAFDRKGRYLDVTGFGKTEDEAVEDCTRRVLVQMAYREAEEGPMCKSFRRLWACLEGEGFDRRPEEFMDEARRNGVVLEVDDGHNPPSVCQFLSMEEAAEWVAEAEGVEEEERDLVQARLEDGGEFEDGGDDVYRVVFWGALQGKED